MIHLSPWQTAPWPDRVDCIITDPPYSERTHEGHNHATREGGPLWRRTALSYTHLTPADCHEWAATWAPRVRYWCAIMTDHVLFPHWQEAFRAAGMYANFAPVSCVIPGMTVRVAGDGPASWAVYLMVARTKACIRDDFGRINGEGKRVRGWGSLPGFYTAERAQGYIGGKPLPLMQQIVRDYSCPGMLVADPCAGHATTLVAARLHGCDVWGAESDPAAHAAGVARLDAVQVPTLIPPDRSFQPSLLPGSLNTP